MKTIEKIWSLMGFELWYPKPFCASPAPFQHDRHCFNLGYLPHTHYTCMYVYLFPADLSLSLFRCVWSELRSPIWT